MAQVDRFRPEDRRAIEALYRRVFGHDAADASRLRWEWQYGRNPNNPSEGPLIWVAREGATVIAHCAAMPVRLGVAGRETDAAWGTDVMVAPERQRQGVGEVLFRTWDRAVGAALGLGPSEASWQLFRKLRWPDIGTLPCFFKPLTRRAFWRPTWPVGANRLLLALAHPLVRILARTRPLRAEARPVQRFDERFTDLWARVAPKLAFAVRRDARYLNWKYVSPPHVRYAIAAIEREGRVDGYAVYRHVHEPHGRATLLVDYLADPDDEAGFKTLLRWVDREARASNADKIRAYALHASFRRLLRRSGYFQVRSSVRLIAKINAFDLPADFYRDLDQWHVTSGDSDLDR